MENSLFDILDDQINFETEKKGGALKNWTPSLAQDFHNKKPKEIIESDYFLNMKEVVYPFHMETIEEIYLERAKRKIDLVILNQSIGAGKTTVASVLTYLEWYYFSTIPDKRQAFPFIDPKSIVAFILMSRDKDKAKRVVFSTVYRLFDSQFNRDYFPPNKNIRTYLDIPRNNTLIFPGTGEAASALGFNLFSGVVDEASWLQQTASKDSSSSETEDSAQAMYEQIHGRIESRFGNRGGPVIMITSANKASNWIELKINDAIKFGNERDKIFWKRAGIWHAKPPKFFPLGEVFLFNAKTYEIITDIDMIREFFEARNRLELNSSFNHVLGGLLL